MGVGGSSGYDGGYRPGRATMLSLLSHLHRLPPPPRSEGGETIDQETRQRPG